MATQNCLELVFIFTLYSMNKQAKERPLCLLLCQKADYMIAIKIQSNENMVVTSNRPTSNLTLL